jgi:hypothetical protein
MAAITRMGDWRASGFARGHPHADTGV